MGSLDDLPNRHSNHDRAEAAEIAFVTAVDACKLFLVQQKDRSDYGTDAQLEARWNGRMTNLRVHVQLKGTDAATKADGSVSVEIARSNLNYLLAQRDSIFVCYHIPTQRLLVRFAHDVYSEYESRGKEWLHQDTVTVRFSRPFDEEFQNRLNAKVIASGNSMRDLRLEWLAAPPDRIPSLVDQSIPLIEVPIDPEHARVMLTQLYEGGYDSAISKSFLQFSAVLDPLPGAMDQAYMAEINLGINGLPIDEDRIRRGIEIFENEMQENYLHPGTLLYCQANGWLALHEYERAYELYKAALPLMASPSIVDVAAQCCKNMGAALEAMGRIDEARESYEKALRLDPQLGEVYFALGLWQIRYGKDYCLALSHLDRVSRRKGSALRISAVQGWRIELLFRTGDSDGAFREIQNLLNEAETLPWAWPWCARQVAEFGRASIDSTRRSLVFWSSYLDEDPDNKIAERERLFCLSQLHAAGETTGIDFGGFKSAVVRLIESGDSESALLWDRVGHWTQDGDDWIQAESAYRKAYELEPDQYGYCLGTALNFLGRFDDALPILLAQAEEHKQDAMSWFQVAVSYGGIGNLEASITAYKRALELDEDYDLAWFNLGGMYWNLGAVEQAIAIWSEAVVRFPDHALAQDVLLLLLGEHYLRSEL